MGITHKSEGEGRRRGGFTLTELLVVIGLIVILTALLMPVLASHRDSVKRSECASNLRQVGIAAMAYVADNDGKLPVIAVNNLGIHNSVSPGLIDLLGSYTDGQYKVFYCTDGLVRYKDQLTRPDVGVPNNRFHEIGYYWTQAAERPFFIPVGSGPRLANFSPTKGILGMCLHFSGYPVHQNRVNVLFADGHTESLKGDPRGNLYSYVSEGTFQLSREF